METGFYFFLCNLMLSIANVSHIYHPLGKTFILISFSIAAFQVLTSLVEISLHFLDIFTFKYLRAFNYFFAAIKESFKSLIIVFKMNTELWGTAEPSAREL